MYPREPLKLWDEGPWMALVLTQPALSGAVRGGLVPRAEQTPRQRLAGLRGPAAESQGQYL